MRLTYNIGWSAIWRVFLAFVLVVGAYFAREAIIALVFAIVLSLALDAPVDFLNKKFKFPRIIATSLIFMTGIFLMVFIISLILPIVIIEFSSLIGQFMGDFEGSLFRDLLPIIDILTTDFSIANLGQIMNIIFSGTMPVARTISDIIGGIAFSLSILIISFYLTLSKDGVGRFLRAVLPEKVEDSVLKIFYRSKEKIGKWFQAQMVLSFVVGTLVSLGLWILGVEYALAIGLLAAIFEIMPVVGPIFSGAVGVIVAVSSSLTLGIYTLVFFVLVQQVENHLLVPLFMKKAVNIHPVAALFAILVGSQLLGIIGMIIAVPIAVIVQDVIEERIERKNQRKNIL